VFYIIVCDCLLYRGSAAVKIKSDYTVGNWDLLTVQYFVLSYAHTTMIQVLDGCLSTCCSLHGVGPTVRVMDRSWVYRR